jgi:hypothetical protein
MRAHGRELHDTGEVERTIIALRGAGLSATRFAGHNLVTELLARRRGDGSFGGQVNLTAFAILALRADGRSAGSTVVRRAAAWLAREQNVDGGFSFAERGAAGDVDDTGAVLQALGSAGRAEGASSRRALAYLRRQQNADGGFGQLAGSRSNAQSTAWAVQGLLAVGKDPRGFGRRSGRSPLAYLQSLQQGDGSFRYSRTSTQTPVWVTAQAIVAVRRMALPLRPLSRTPRVASRPIVPARSRHRRQARSRLHPRAAALAALRGSHPSRAPSSGFPAAEALRPVAQTSPARSGERGSAWLALALLLGAATLAAAWLTRRRLARARSAPGETPHS